MRVFFFFLFESWTGDELIGRATSGGYGWRVNKSLALAMVRPDLAEIGTEFEIVILGERHNGTGKFAIRQTEPENPIWVDRPFLALPAS
jgi:dimethylglycine dehydrogenase